MSNPVSSADIVSSIRERELEEEILRLKKDLDLAKRDREEKALDKVVAGPCFTAADLPTRTSEEHKAPGTTSVVSGLLELMGVEDGDADGSGEDDED